MDSWDRLLAAPTAIEAEWLKAAAGRCWPGLVAEPLEKTEALQRLLHPGEALPPALPLSGRHAFLLTSAATLEDLQASPAIRQLLSIPGIDWSPIVLMPTAAAVRVARVQCRNQDIEAAFHFLEADAWPDLASRLPPDAVIGTVPAFTILSDAYARALRAVLAGQQDEARGHFEGVSIEGAVPAGAGRAKALPGAIFRRRAWPLATGAGPDLYGLRMVLPSGARSSGSPAVGDAGPSTVPPDLTARIHAMDTAFAAEIRRTPAAPSPAPQAEPAAGPGVEMVAHGSDVRIPLPDPDDGQDGIVTVSGVRADGETPRLILRAHTALLEDRSALTARLPFALIGQAPIQGNVRLERDGVAIRTSPLTISLPAAHLQPDMVTCFLNRGGAGNPIIQNFSAGIGCAMRYAEDETEARAPVSVVWGVLRGSDRVVELARDAGRHFFYIDHAYFRRGHYFNYRITRNAYEAGRIRACPSDRADALGVSLKPWHRGGEGILVCPPTEYFMTAHGCPTWLEDTLATLRSVTDRPIIVRNKPQPGEAFEPLEVALARSHALVTHSSNVAVEAVVSGTPVFVAPTSAAAPMGRTDLHRIEEPVYPDRGPWLAHLAYSQFSFDEIGTGAAWRMLLEWETRDFV